MVEMCRCSEQAWVLRGCWWVVGRTLCEDQRESRAAVFEDVVVVFLKRDQVDCLFLRPVHKFWAVFVSISLGSVCSQKVVSMPERG